VVVALGVVVAAVAITALTQHKSGKVSGSRTTVFNTVAPSTVSRSTSAARSTSHAPTHTPSTSASTRTSTGATTDAKSVPLIVLNDTTTSGLARGAAQRFTNGGWKVTSSGNLPSGISDILSTCAYYDPSVTGAKAAAQALQAQYPTIKRVRPRFDQLPSGPVVVVLTSDYSAG
jgi:hypothetical protein